MTDCRSATVAPHTSQSVDPLHIRVGPGGPSPSSLPDTCAALPLKPHFASATCHSVNCLTDSIGTNHRASYVHAQRVLNMAWVSCLPLVQSDGSYLPIFSQIYL